jgi:hypothetical protein
MASQEADDDDEALCQICLNVEADVIMFPCSHRLCSECLIPEVKRTQTQKVRTPGRGRRIVCKWRIGAGHDLPHLPRRAACAHYAASPHEGVRETSVSLLRAGGAACF